MRKKNNRWLFLIWFSFQPFKQIGNHGPFRFMTDACTSSVESIYFWKRQMFFYVVAVRRHVCRSWASTEEFIVRPRERGFRLSDKGILFLSSTFFFCHLYTASAYSYRPTSHIHTQQRESCYCCLSDFGQQHFSSSPRVSVVGNNGRANAKECWHYAYLILPRCFGIFLL